MAKNIKLWRANGQLNLAYKRLAATKASKVWFSYSHNCTLANGTVSILSAKFDCPVARQNFLLLAAAHYCKTGLIPHNPFLYWYCISSCPLPPLPGTNTALKKPHPRAAEVWQILGKGIFIFLFFYLKRQGIAPDCLSYGPLTDLPDWTFAGKNSTFHKGQP